MCIYIYIEREIYIYIPKIGDYLPRLLHLPSKTTWAPPKLLNPITVQHGGAETEREMAMVVQWWGGCGTVVGGGGTVVELQRWYSGGAERKRERWQWKRERERIKSQERK